ncbi:MAG TPA: STAS domain-containing protein [Capsulimonadaceae bacterium]|jgi:anti-sigma B factor antagonist
MDKTPYTSSSDIVGGVPILRVSGEIDIYTAPLFKESIIGLVDEGHANILIDMTNVAFMDSSGFGTLLSASKPLRPMGGSLSLTGCNEAISRMLEITRLNTLVPVYKTLDEALAKVKPLRVEPALV